MKHRGLQLQLGADHRHSGPLHDQAHRQSGRLGGRFLEMFPNFRLLNTMQVECHAFFNQSKLLEFCRERDVAVAAFSPLGSPARPWAGEETENLLEDPKLKEIAEQHGKSVAQVRIILTNSDVNV